MLRVLAGLTLCAFAAAAHAAVQYVVEQVVVSVSSSPDGAGEHLATIKSGDPVELLERQGEEAHIRVASGQEGWVRASYLSAEPPLRAQLTERSAQVAALTRDVSRLQSELNAARTSAGAAPAANARPPAAAQQPAPDAEDPQAAPERGGVAWRIGALLLALGAGFALGWRMLDRRIRRRYGGLRIY